MERKIFWPYVIMDGQWGSTGKGLIAGFLAVKRCPDAVVCNFGPNAGHTFITPDGETVMTQQLPTGIVTPGPAKIFIGPGSIIDPDLMESELEKFAHHLKNKTLLIHPRAAIVLPEHKAEEKKALGSISSTQKGTGAAVADKVMRNPLAVCGTHKDELTWGEFITDEATYFNELMNSRVIQIESAQGFELGLNQGTAYPYCTSRDVTPAQILNDCGLPHWLNPEVIVTLRTFPIRVGHQLDKNGKKVGDSGPVYADQQELDWEKDFPHLTPEKTTVTQKIRRIFTFSDEGFQRMCRYVRPDKIFLNFVNYLEEDPSFDSAATALFIEHLAGLYWTATGNYNKPSNDVVPFIGTGPAYADVKER